MRKGSKAQLGGVDEHEVVLLDVDLLCFRETRITEQKAY